MCVSTKLEYLILSSIIRWGERYAIYDMNMIIFLYTLILDSVLWTYMSVYHIIVAQLECKGRFLNHSTPPPQPSTWLSEKRQFFTSIPVSPIPILVSKVKSSWWLCYKYSKKTKKRVKISRQNLEKYRYFTGLFRTLGQALTMALTKSLVKCIKVTVPKPGSFEEEE